MYAYGFPLEVGKYPLLPSGLTTLTPLLFNVLCLLSAERMPVFHALLPRLIRECQTANPVEEGFVFRDEHDPTIDIELGIGPEEITAVALLSMFAGDASCNGADQCGRSALNWARGLGKVR